MLQTTYIPMPLRIIAYLRKARHPQHFSVIARHLKEKQLKTARACNRMAHDGRLQWVAAGTYTLATEEV